MQSDEFSAPSSQRALLPEQTSVLTRRMLSGLQQASLMLVVEAMRLVQLFDAGSDEVCCRAEVCHHTTAAAIQVAGMRPTTLHACFILCVGLQGHHPLVPDGISSLSRNPLHRLLSKAVPGDLGEHPAVVRRCTTFPVICVAVAHARCVVSS